MANYKKVVKIYDEQLEISADFAQARSQILLDGAPTGWQVADFGHNPRAAFTAVVHKAFSAEGEIDDDEVEPAIAAAIQAAENEDEEDDESGE